MKRNYISSALYSLILSSVLLSCNTKQAETTGSAKQNEVSQPSAEPVFVPTINADSVLYYVKKQVDFGPRVPGSKAHQLCGNFLVTELKSFATRTPEIIEQNSSAITFDNKTIPIRNIIAQFYPEKKKRILLAAHWDTRPFAEMDKNNPHKPIDGANDGASGVGVLMEIARQLSMHEPAMGVDIIFFDAEDWGDTTGKIEDSYCLGSQYWAQNPHKPNYLPQFGILLDMVGGKNAKFAIEEQSWRMAQNIVDKVWTTAYRLGYEKMFISERRGAIIDDHYYVMKYRQIPMIDIINYDPESYSRFGNTWHTHDDNISNISYETLSAVTNTVIHVIYEEK
ncbi:MAG: M28 family peptidase [Bacteroidetes bacterium]|nr:M28 family peptidase [Bacteroidota bacterium]